MSSNRYVKPIKNLDELGNNYSIIKVTKEGCCACEQLKPVFEEFAKRYFGKLSCYEANVADMPELVPRCNIQAFPYLALFNNNRFVGGFIGARFAGGIGGERVAVELENLEKVVKRWLSI